MAEGFKGTHWNKESHYTWNHLVLLTKFSIFKSGSSIYHFPFFSSPGYSIPTTSPTAWKPGGKFPCGPNARAWRDNPTIDRTVSVYRRVQFAIWALPPSLFCLFAALEPKQPLSTAPDLNLCKSEPTVTHTNSHICTRKYTLKLNYTLLEKCNE